MSVEIKYTRTCPECGLSIKHKNKYDAKRANKLGVSCKSCYSKRMTGRKLSDEIKNKLSQARVGHITTEETRDKISKANSGVNNGMYGKHHSDESKLKISNCNIERWQNPSYRFKMLPKLFQIGNKTGFREHQSSETRLKMRLAAIKRIESQIKVGMSPNYNSSACQYFDRLMQETNTFIQHAENGGEYHIKELGYWVDGYDKENNIVYEYDEGHHFNKDGELCENDIRRQKEIEKFLKCKFIRIKE